MALAVDVIDMRCSSNEPQLQPKETTILAVYIATRRFSRPSLLTRRSASVLKVGVLYELKIAKFVASYRQRRLR